MARVRKTVPYTGKYPHREHRSKKGRRPRSGRTNGKPDYEMGKRRRKRLEELRDEEIQNMMNDDYDAD